MSQSAPHKAELDSALSALADSVLVFNSDGSSFSFNDAFITFHRFASRQEAYDAVVDYVNSLEVRRLDGTRVSAEGRLMPRALRGESGSNEVYRLRRPDTGEEWVASYSFAPIRDETGTVAGGIVLARDITSQALLEDELRRATQIAEAHFENSPLAVIEFDAEMRVIRWSDEAVRVFGYERDEMLGRTISEVRWVYEADVALVETESRGFIEGSRTRGKHVNRNYRKDGTVISCEWYNSAIYDGDGKLVSVLSLVDDVTEREQLLAALKASEQRAQDLIQYAPTGICEIDFQARRFTRVNDAMSKMSGYSCEELLRMDPLEVLDEPSRRKLMARIMVVAQGLADDELEEYVVCRKDGSELVMTLNLKVHTDGEGRPLTGSMIGHDTTERRHNEDERARLLDEERANARMHESLTEIDGLIHGTLDRDRVFELVATEAAKVLGADSAGVMLSQGAHWVLGHVFGMPDSMAGQEFTPDEVPLTKLAAASGRPVAVDDTASDPRTGDSHILLDSRAVMTTPVIVGGHAVAVVGFNYSHPHHFSHREIAFASRLASSLGLALANVQLFEAEREVAETLQETLIVVPAHVDGVRYSRSYQSSTLERGRVGGDFIDVFEVRGNLVGLSLGDVSGKGIDAAVTTSLIRTTLRVHTLDGQTPSQVGGKANEVMRKFTESDAFVTLWFGLLNTRTGVLRYICAGHPPAMVLGRDGSIRQLDCPDPILGVFEGAVFTERQARLGEGDRLVLYSDGVTEARAPDGTFLDPSGLEGLLGQHWDLDTSRLSDAIMDAVICFSDGVLRDDAAVLAVEPVRLRRNPGDDAQLQAFGAEDC